MESVNDVKEALSARSRTATLDQLASEGRKRVRLIRAEHVAAMITEAVHSAIEQSGLVGQDEVDRLVEKSRQEFRSILKEREAEAARAQEVEDQLAAMQQRVAELEGDAEGRAADQDRLAAEAARATELREQLRSSVTELDQLREEHEGLGRTLAELRAEHDAVQAELAQLRAAPASTPAPVATPPGMSPEVMAMMLNEIASLKAQAMQRQTAAPAADTAGLSDALEKIAGSLNDRLDQFGKKMGISSAVEAADVDFSAMFAKADDARIESNMDAIQVKQTSGGGIGANLARLKKLKGG